VTNTVPVSGIFWQATQPVSGTVTSNQGGAPWTVKPDGTAWTMTSTSANVNVSNASIPVTGTFWQATQPVSGTVTANQGGTWNITNVSGTVSLPTGASTSANQPTNAAQGSTTSGQTGNLAMGAVTTGNPTYTTAQTSPLSLDTSGALRVNVIAGSGGGGTSSSFGSAFPATGTAAGGEYLSTPPTLTNGQMVALQTNVSGALKVDGSAVTQPVSGTFWQTTQPVSGTVTANQGGAPWSVNGDTASGSADANNPVKIGGVARTSNPTAVTNGQRVNGIFDKLGKQVCVGAIRDVKGVQKTSITTTTETTVVTAGGVGVFNDVYAIVVTNKSATTVFVDFRDSTAGTVRMTLAAPASDTRGFTVAVDSAMVQAGANANWTATLSGAATSIEISMLYVSNL
jgi:hypothetical protein